MKSIVHRYLVESVRLPVLGALVVMLAVAAESNAATLVVDALTATIDGDTTSITTLTSTPGLDGKISLHEAITAANNTPGSDTIHFDGALDGAFITTPSTAPAITDPLILDGEGLNVTLDFDGASGQAALMLTTGSSMSTINGLSIINAFAAGVVVDGDSSNNTLSNLKIYNNNGAGIAINGENGAGSNTIQGCFIGTDGTSSLGNSSHGVYIQNSSDNTVGGLSLADRNYISGNGGAGIVVEVSNSGLTANNNTLINNYIGVGTLGTSITPNDSYGIRIQSVEGDVGAVNNTQIGEVFDGGNVIVGHGPANISLSSTSVVDTKIHANYIGVAADGLTPVAVDGGVGLELRSGVSQTKIGGTAGFQGNVISGNNGGGIFISDSNENLIQDNYIGLGSDGTTAVPNGSVGVFIAASSFGSTGNVIGGSADGANKIAHNGSHGVQLQRATSNVQATTITYNSIFANSGDGINFAFGSENSGVPAPSVDSLSATKPYSATISVSGGLAAGDIIHVYADGGSQGEFFLAKAVVTNAGVPITIPVNLAPHDGGFVTATLSRDAGGGALNTSQFSLVSTPNQVPQIPPTIFLDANSDQADPTDALPIAFDLKADEPIEGFDGSDIVNDGTAGGVTFAVIDSGDGTEYTVNATATSDGTIQPRLPAASAMDLSGNVNPDDSTNSSSDGVVTYDTEAPSITVDTLITNVVSPALSGTIDDFGATISVVVDGANSVAATNNQDGTWTLSAGELTPLADGVYEVEATADDGVNEQLDSTSLELTIDTVLPTAGMDVLITNDPSPPLSGFNSDSTATILVGVGTDGELSAVNNGATWNLADNLISDLMEGHYDVMLDLIDPAGNINNVLLSGVLIIDLTDPLLTIDNTITADQTPTLTGTVTDNTSTTVSVTADGQVVAATVSGGVWSADIPNAIVEGTYRVDVEAVDAAGNMATASAANGLAIDTSPPVVTVDNIVTSNTQPGLTGTVDDGSPSRTNSVLIDLLINGSTYSASNNNDGTWSLDAETITPPLTNGVYDVTVTATDSVGNVGTDGTTDEVTVDLAAPTVTVDNVFANTSLPVLTGTVEDMTETTVSVLVNGETVAAVVTDTTWRAEVLTPLADGVYDIAATATDAVGGVTSDNTIDELLVDTMVPQITVSPLVTTNINPTITGTVQDENLSDVHVTVDAIAYTATIVENNWSVVVTTALAPNMIYNVLAEALDSAGNRGADATNGELTIDTEAPVVTVNTLVTAMLPPIVSGTVSDLSAVTVNVVVDGESYSAAVDNGAWTALASLITEDGTYEVAATATDAAGNSAGDGTTNELQVDTVLPVVTVDPLNSPDSTPLLSGTVIDSNAVTLNVTINGSTYSAVVDGSTWSVAVTSALPDGTYDVAAVATDEAGNTGSDATTDEVTILATIPSITLDELITSDVTPQLTGTAMGDNAIVAVTVVINGISYDATINDTQWTADITDALPEGVYSVMVTAEDTDGTSGMQTFAGAVVVDLTPPVVTVDALTTNTATPRITGTIMEEATNVSLVISVGGREINVVLDGNTWSATLDTPLADGTYDVIATATDGAGNIGRDSSTDELIVNSIAPSATSLLRTGASPTNATQVEFTLRFNEPVQGVDESDFTIVVDDVPQKGKVIGGLPLGLTLDGAGALYTITVETGSGDGTIALLLDSDGSIQDTQGSVLEGALESDGAFVIDRTSPTLTISSTATNPTNVSPIPVTVAFSELISGFSPDAVSLTNAVVESFEGDGLVYMASLIPIAPGPISIVVAPEAVQDEAGNGNKSGAQFAITYEAGVEGEGEGEGEVENCIDECVADTTDADGDGLSPCIEACIGTSDDNTDSDGDGMADNFEFDFGLNPRVDDASLDKDDDDLSNLEEFLQNSDPTNPASPNGAYFVATTGSDTEGTGSVSQPWRTINFALSQATPTRLRRARVIVATGEYVENVVMRASTIITGASGAEVIIKGQVTGAGAAALRRVTVMPAGGEAYLFDMNNVAMELTEVVFMGSPERDMTGMLIDGVRPADSLIDLCTFTRLGVGIDIGGAIPVIRRCTFDDIPESFGNPPTPGAAIVLRVGDGTKQTGSETQSIGDATDPETGWNDFLPGVEGLAVINERDETVLMQDNYWGFTEPEDFNMRVDGPAVLEPVLARSSAVLAASLFVTVWQDTDQKRIGDASIDLKVSSFKSITDNSDGIYAFPAMPEGQYNVFVNAPGFLEQSMSIDVAGGELKSLTIAMRAAAPAEGEGEGEGGGCPRPAAARKAISAHGSDIFLGGLTLIVFLALGRQYQRRRDL